MRTSDLSSKIALRLIQDIASGSILPGTHIGAQQFAERYGVSRTPVREALENLEQNKFLKRIPNRGFFVSDPVPGAVEAWLQDGLEAQSDEYQRLADDWLADNITEEVTENHLRQRYGWTKSKLNDVLARAAREGWAERKEGYGWRFLPVAKSAESFDEIYRFRMTIEPAALLEPTFSLDRKVLDEQKRIQTHMLESNLEGVPDETLLMNGSRFHEELIKLSGNPFFLAALQRVNRMRRLMEYRAEINRARLVEQCSEHLDIIDLLNRGEIVEASFTLRQHLSGALKRKSPIAWNWETEAGHNPSKGRAIS